MKSAGAKVSWADIFPGLLYLVGNGNKTFLWLDNWHPLGPLLTKFGARVVYNFGRNLFAKVASIIVDQKWHWPRERNSVTREIIRNTPDSFIPHLAQEETMVWNLNASGKFSIQSAWNAFRSPKPVVEWAKVVWFKPAIPRWSIIQWLAILRRLSTKDRLHHLGCVDGGSMCTIVGWMVQHHKGSLFLNLVSKEALAALVYHVWGERNSRIFQHCNLMFKQWRPELLRTLELALVLGEEKMDQQTTKKLHQQPLLIAELFPATDNEKLLKDRLD
ncbi:uncharacterized protein LOC131298698 [Rhododendron vialii]|uniref:uncharacterized protein LOC131298698 n=1 Tax=Rhododendron vialii TaxID=182163 RepID=UPI00265FE260|nr:uncharacterized protein LOC131298698 [Rhododendron vialii]